MPYDVLTTAPAIKAWAKLDGDVSSLTPLIAAASEAIGRFCGRPNLGKIYSYTENYFPPQRAVQWWSSEWIAVLRHYPVVTLTSVVIANAAVPILSNSDLQVGTAGCYLQVDEEEPRVLRFRSIIAYNRTPALVTYTAGYDANAIPPMLAQACNQLVLEWSRGASNVNLKSVGGLGGETTTYDMGTNWGMSKRVMSMLQPYRNVAVPYRVTG